MLRIVTDSTADMPASWEKEYDIQIIPINIQFGEKTYLQGVDLSNEDFYRMVEESGKIPKTSQPSPFQFTEFYKRVAKEGATILSIHVTSKLSGTFDSAVAAARELAGKYNVIPFDSASGSMAIGFMCREARLMERAGAAIQKIQERLEKIRSQVSIVLTLDTLDYARMSGRVGTLQAALASVLNVKPIVVLHDGILEMSEKVRTRSKALERVLELVSEKFGKQPVNVSVIHARDIKSGQALMELARKRFDCRDMVLADLAISLVANFGPGTVGLIAYPA
ncbi:MAG: DegV family protein [Anaerolineales bacterium]|nr:DegV family protein [Anaerolineales bacterium]MDP3185085.1 DegV family protein [Anaerolineales bacterium]